MFKPPSWFYTFVPFRFAAGCSSPLIPLLIIALKGTATDISIVSTAYSVASMIFLVIWGKLSDATQRRKPFLVMGFCGFSVSLLLFSQADTLTDVLSIHVLSAVFAAAIVPVSSVYLLRSARKEFWDQAIGEFNKISGYAWAAGMLFGIGLLALLGMQFLFIFLGVTSLVSAVLFQKMVREKPIYIDRDKITSFANVITEKFRLMPSYVIHFPQFVRVESKRLRDFYFASFVLFVSSGLIFTPFVYFLTEKGATASFVFFVSFLSAVISAYFYSRTAKKVALFGGFAVLQRGLAVRVIFFFILVGASILSRLYAVGVAAVCYCVFGYTWSEITISSNSVMSRLAVKGKEGKIMGMYNFMASLGLIAGNLISGIVVDTWGFFAEFVLGLVAIGLSLAWIQKIKAREDKEMKMEVKDVFEKTIAERKKWWNVLTFQKIDQYLDFAGVKKGNAVLDVATGDGVVAFQLAKRGCKVVAMDISPALIGQRMYDITYIVKDAEQMDFQKVFDVVTLRNSFHYFPNPLQVLKGIHQALKKGGIFLLMEPAATKESYSFLKKLFEKKAPLRTFFTAEELKTMIESEGFTIRKMRTEDYINWVRTDSEEKAEGVKTSYKNGILYFQISSGYAIIVARKKSKHIPFSL